MELEVNLLEKLPAPPVVDVDAQEVTIHEAVASSFKPYFVMVVGRLTSDVNAAKTAIDFDDLDTMNEILIREKVITEEGKMDLPNAKANLKAWVEEVWEKGLSRVRKFKEDVTVEGFIPRTNYESFLKSKYADEAYCIEKGISDDDHQKAKAFVESVINYDSLVGNLLAVKTALTDHAENLKWVPLIEKNEEAKLLIKAVVAYKGLVDDYNEAVTLVRKFNGVKPANLSTKPTATGSKSKLGSYVVHLADGTEFGGSIKAAAFATMRHFGIKTWKVNSTETMSTDTDPVDNKALTGNTNSWHSIVVKINSHLVENKIDVEGILYAQTNTGELVTFKDHK